MKFISIYTIEAAAHTGGPTETQMTEMGKLIGEMQAAGILLDAGGAEYGGMQLRVQKTGAQMTVTDGPFTETKEVVGGFGVLKVATRDEAIYWTKRFMETAGGDGVSELHQLSEFD